STTPTISWPGTIGILGCGSSPSTTCRSVRQTPQARTRTSTWPAAGSGTGRSTGSSSPGPCRVRVIVCIDQGAIVHGAGVRSCRGLECDRTGGWSAIVQGTGVRSNRVPVRSSSWKPSEGCQELEPRAAERVFGNGGDVVRVAGAALGVDHLDVGR